MSARRDETKRLPTLAEELESGRSRIIDNDFFVPTAIRFSTNPSEYIDTIQTRGADATSLASEFARFATAAGSGNVTVSLNWPRSSFS